MKLSQFDYNLPQRYIAQTPQEPRDHAKLMVVHKSSGLIEHKHFYDIKNYLNSNDVLVANDSKVMAARLFGKKITGARVEILLLHRESVRRWEALVKPAKRLKIGDKIIDSAVLNQEWQATVIKELEEGRRIIEFNVDILEKLDKVGIIPLPPYIKFKPDHESLNVFRERYQTVYSKIIGSAAAPTAGLHFTPALIGDLRNKGVGFEFVTLHIGLDTFRPIKAESIEKHKMHKEYCEMKIKTARELKKAKEQGKRIIAIGTTATRVLETAKDGEFKAFKGWTDIFIYPGYKFKAIDAMITNFHLPKSSLLLMVSAFASKELIFKAYNEAKKYDYRFFSFGDAMLIL